MTALSTTKRNSFPLCLMQHSALVSERVREAKRRSRENEIAMEMGPLAAGCTYVMLSPLTEYEGESAAPSESGQQR